VTDRDFRQLGHDLEQTAVKLKGTKDPNLRRDLLKKMRLLLKEADRLLLEMPHETRRTTALE
jgi:hypothetical protein